VDVDSKPHLLEIVAAVKEATASITSAATLTDAADDLVALTANLLPTRIRCAVTLISQGEPTIFAATRLDAEVLDEARYAAGDGPCLQAIRTRDIVVSQDLGSDQRWPRWSAIALAHGVRAVLSYPFDIDGLMLAALNLYGGDRDAFVGETPVIAMLMADHASLLLRVRMRQTNQDDLLAQVNAVADDHASVQRAVGIIMAQRACAPDQALRHLHDAATHLGVGLAVVAERLVRTVADRNA
jgi:hypothetical protein